MHTTCDYFCIPTMHARVGSQTLISHNTFPCMDTRSQAVPQIEVALVGR